MFVPELVHQAVRLAIWFGRCAAAAMRAWLLRTHEPKPRRPPMWLARILVPYPWRFWQVTYVSAIGGLLLAGVIGQIAIEHNPQCEFSGDLAGYALLYVLAFGWGFLAIELPHQFFRLFCWCWLVWRHVRYGRRRDTGMAPA